MGKVRDFHKDKHCGCGDWCPLFGEPDIELDYDLVPDPNHIALAIKVYKNCGNAELELCHKSMVFDELTDERVK
jgi:hypothetical protein